MKNQAGKKDTIQWLIIQDHIKYAGPYIIAPTVTLGQNHEREIRQRIFKSLAFQKIDRCYNKAQKLLKLHNSYQLISQAGTRKI
jgi:hypothetical protein